MTEEEVDAMPWPQWSDYKRFAEFRLGLKRNEDGEEDIEYG